MVCLFLSVFLWASCRHCFERPPPGSDLMLFLCLGGPCYKGPTLAPVWRVMSIAPAGSSSNSSSVHIKTRTSHPPSSSTKTWGGQDQGGCGGVGGVEPELPDYSICPLPLLHRSLPLSVSRPPPPCFSLICFLEPSCHWCHPLRPSRCAAHSLHDMCVPTPPPPGEPGPKQS